MGKKRMLCPVWGFCQLNLAYGDPIFTPEIKNQLFYWYA